MSMECSLLQSQSYAKSGGGEEENEGHELEPNSCQRGVGSAKEVSEIPSKIDKVANLYFTMTVAG